MIIGWWDDSYNVCVQVCLFFFFQAEDGIRDLTVTGVQTCALPICLCGGDALQARRLPALRVQDERLRPLLEEDRDRDSRDAFRARGARGSRAPRAAVRRYRVRDVRVVRRRQIGRASCRERV